MSNRLALAGVFFDRGDVRREPVYDGSSKPMAR